MLFWNYRTGFVQVWQAVCPSTGQPSTSRQSPAVFPFLFDHTHRTPANCQHHHLPCVTATCIRPLKSIAIVFHTSQRNIIIILFTTARHFHIHVSPVTLHPPVPTRKRWHSLHSSLTNKPTRANKQPRHQRRRVNFLNPRHSTRPRLPLPAYHPSPLRHSPRRPTCSRHQRTTRRNCTPWRRWVITWITWRWRMQKWRICRARGARCRVVGGRMSCVMELGLPISPVRIPLSMLASGKNASAWEKAC